ncbi:MAG: type VI secretion system tip protein TssI/VgrG [Reinekea sp.]
MTTTYAPIIKAARQLFGADSSQYYFQISDLPANSFLVESVSLKQWGFHQDFKITLKVLVLKELEDDSLLHSPASLQLNLGSELKFINGVISEWADGDGNGDYRGLHLTVSSVLQPLKDQQHNRVFVNQSATEIAQKLLTESLVNLASIKPICNPSPVLPMTVQYHESDYDFIRRILAKEGIFLNLHQEGANTEVQLCDALEQLIEYKHTLTQRYITNTGTTKDDTHVYAIECNRKHSVGQVSLNNYQPWQSGDLNVNATVENHTGSGTTEQWGLNYESTEAGQQLALRMAQVLAWKGQTLTLHTTLRDVSPGMSIHLVNHQRFSGHYRVIEITFSGSQRAATGGTNDKSWQCQLTVLPASVPWLPPYTPRKPHYAAMSAIVTEEIDEQGCYRVRLPFDQRHESDGLSSAPVRLMQPLGGRDHGMHFPLAKGTEVSVLCENGDLDRPYIQGTLYNEQAENPVTNSNPHQNLIRTRGDHQFLFDDTPDKEHIHLTTPKNKNHLTLSANANGHHAELMSEDGEIRLHAGEFAVLKSGKDTQITVGTKHSIQVQQDYRLQTQEGEIQIEAATDLAFNAGKAIHIHNTEQNIELSAAQAMNLQAGNHFKQQVDRGDCTTLVSDGGYQLTTGKDQVFNSQGAAITLTQGDAILQLDGSGSLTLDASTIELTADKIAIKGFIGMD